MITRSLEGLLDGLPVNRQQTFRTVNSHLGLG